MTFENKSKKIQEVLVAMANHPEALTAQAPICALCGNHATEFRDALSKKEYGISRMCQECQDSVFIG